MPITEDDLDELMSVPAAAEFLRVSTATINRMIANRDVEVTRIGSGRGRVRITKRALLDHANRNTVRANRTRTA
jgi:excisionase family DNA binding protein